MLVDYNTGDIICQKNPNRRMYNDRFVLTGLGSADLLPRYVSLDFGWDVGYGFVEKKPLAGLTYVSDEPVDGKEDVLYNDFLYCSYTEEQPTKENCDFFIKGKAIIDGLRKFDRNSMFDVNTIYADIKRKVKNLKKKNRFTCSYCHDRVFGFPERYRKYDGSNEDLRIMYEIDQERQYYMNDIYECYVNGYYRGYPLRDDYERISDYFEAYSYWN